MLTDIDILRSIADQRRDLPFHIVTSFSDSTSFVELNKRIFKSELLPVPPPLCFFESDDDSPGLYKLSSFFSDTNPNYDLVPFGRIEAPEVDLGMSYNVFYSGLPIQSYTICQNTENIPKRAGDQSDYFRETHINHEKWSAGHLIAHRYTPEYMSVELAATLQHEWNFIPEPRQWNCYQRNFLENRCANGYYGVYPIYNLRFQHGRTVKSYNKLPYRPVPDGEFFLGHKSSGDRFTVYMPFVADSYKVYDSKVYENAKCKLDVTVNNHTINYSAMPQNITLDFKEDRADITAMLKRKIIADIKLSNAQGNIFQEELVNPLHQAAVIQRERAATLEFKTPCSKMNCALIFSDLGNRKKTNLFLQATKSHAKFLLDKCDAENPPCKLFPEKLLKRFTEKFSEQEQTLEVLSRLKFHHKGA